MPHIEPVAQGAVGLGVQDQAHISKWAGCIQRSSTACHLRSWLWLVIELGLVRNGCKSVLRVASLLQGDSRAHASAATVGC
jgi:hypothetical protein